jgi:hypothetical protein
MAPSVSTSRMAVKPASRSCFTFRVAGIVSVLPGLFEQNVVIVRVVSIREHDVRMAIDQSGQDGCVSQIHRGGACRNLHFAARSEALDAVATNDNHLVVVFPERTSSSFPA